MTNTIKHLCNLGPFGDQRDYIVGWYNNIVYNQWNFEHKHLLIIGDSSFVKELILNCSSDYFSKECIYRAQINIHNKENLFVNFKEFNLTKVKLIFVEDLSLENSNLYKFVDKIFKNDVFRRIPSIFATSDSFRITRSLERIYLYFNIVHLNKKETNENTYQSIQLKKKLYCFLL
jgi:hypothetical protein